MPLACIGHKSLEICDRCRLWQRNSPATPENSAAFCRREFRNSLFRFTYLKRALKQTRSVCLRAMETRSLFGPAVFDRLRRLFRKPGTGGDVRGFIVKNTTCVVPKELIHREADPARVIYLQSKGFVEGILDCICGSFNHRNRKTFSGEFGLDIFPQPQFHKIDGLFGRILRN